MRTLSISISLVCMGVLVGCASSQQTLDSYSESFRSLEYQAHDAMVAGNHALADNLYAQASRQLDQSDESYVDGYFYLDKARMAGNRAFMSLLDGNTVQAREQFSSSERYLTSGVQAHNAVLNEREETQQGITSLLGVGALVGIAAMGVHASTDDPSRAGEIHESMAELMDLTVDLFDGISRSIADIHQLDVHEDAQSVDPDQWRAAILSDHPISGAIVRVSTSPDAPSCTGFFIQPRIVATSAHCLNEVDKGRLWISSHSPRNKDLFLRSPTGRSLDWEVLYWPDNYDWEATCHPADIALVVATEASAYWLWIDTEPVVDPAPGMVVGYSGDLDDGFFQRLDYGCRIGPSADYPGMVSDNCASYPGASGGPVFSVDLTRSESPFQVVGVTSCGTVRTQGQRIDHALFEQGARNYSAGMSALVRLYDSVIAENPTAGLHRLFEYQLE